jgi:hypothetical protein
MKLEIITKNNHQKLKVALEVHDRNKIKNKVKVQSIKKQTVISRMMIRRCMHQRTLKKAAKHLQNLLQLRSTKFQIPKQLLVKLTHRLKNSKTIKNRGVN